jgi:hypothetical protein
MTLSRTQDRVPSEGMAAPRTFPPWSIRFAGPALIVLSVLVVMHGFWLSNRLTSQQVDLLAFWLPRYCTVAKAAAHGHIQTWLPSQFGGVPLASDPQSGWLYLPAMLLFGLVSCGRALGLFITLQPILAGLGLYWFFRHEGVGRPAATAGGLTLALTMTGSAIVLSLPFSGTLAWMAMALAGASGYLHARSPSPRIGWLGFTALALSQVMAAHLTDGLLLTLMVVGAYAVLRLVAQIRAGERRWWPAAGLLGALFGAAPVLAAAVLVPRLALLPRTSIGHGYIELSKLASQLSGRPAKPPLDFSAVGPWWGTSFARGPGGYVGALAILLIPAAFWSKRWRLPATAFALVGVAGFLLNQRVLVSSRAIHRLASHNPLVTLWLHSPYRFRYLLPVAFAGLAGYGLQSWFDRGAAEGAALRRRALWLVPSVAVFGLAPILAGASAAEYLFFAGGVAVSVPLLLLALRGTHWATPALVGLLAAELVVAGLAAQGGPLPLAAGARLETTPSSGLGRSFPKFHAPFINPVDYLTPGPIGRALIDARSRGDTGRYLTYDPQISTGEVRGFLFHQDRANWPAYENGRSVLFGIDEIQGYSPVQMDRYWRLVRRVDGVPIYYNAARFDTIDPQVLKLFAVGWLNATAGTVLPPGATPVASEGAWRLYRLAGAEPRASVVFSARTVTPARSLDAVLTPGFDPAVEAILEGPLPPGQELPAGSGTGSAAYRDLSPQHVRVRVTASAPSLLVVRNVFDRNWRATVDGRPAPVIQVDYLLQGVTVPAGAHTVDLTYHDGAIGLGLAVSGVAWIALLGLWAWFRRRESYDPADPSPPVARHRR